MLLPIPSRSESNCSLALSIKSSVLSPTPSRSVSATSVGSNGKASSTSKTLSPSRSTWLGVILGTAVSTTDARNPAFIDAVPFTMRALSDTITSPQVIPPQTRSGFENTGKPKSRLISPVPIELITVLNLSVTKNAPAKVVGP